MLGYVKIEQCSHGGWYKDLVGQWYPVYRDEGIEWLTYQLDGLSNFILKKDVQEGDVYVTNVETPKGE